MARVEDQVQRFKEATAVFRPVWDTVEVRAVADVRGTKLLGMMACYLPEGTGPRPDNPNWFDGAEDIWFFHGFLSLSDFESLLDSWASGQIRLGGKTLAVDHFSLQPFNGDLVGERVPLGSGRQALARACRIPDISNSRPVRVKARGPGRR